MSKYTYKFNSENLIFYRVNAGVRHKIQRFLFYFAITMVVAVLINIAFSVFFDTPNESRIRRENEKLAKEYKTMQNKFIQARTVLDDVKQRDRNIFRIIFDSKPITGLNEAGLINTRRFEELEELNNNVIVDETSYRLGEIDVQMKRQNEIIQNILFRAENKVGFLSSLPVILPINNSDLKRTAAGWGWKIHPIYKIKKFHKGIDFTAPIGEPVLATGAGVVLDINRNTHMKDGFKIIIDHSYGYQTVYAHLKDFNVRLGQKVKRGDVIGYVGSTGMSTAPHLHFEVIKDGENVNPVFYFFNELSPKQFQQIIHISAQTGQTFD